ncbi:MAG: GGDEF domain-containing protein [Pseudomonadota bacterium]
MPRPSSYSATNPRSPADLTLPGDTGRWKSPVAHATVFALLILTMVGGLLVWIAEVRYRDFEEHQHKLMRASVDGVAGEIGVYLGELRRATHLFADVKSGLLRKISRDPDNTHLHDQLQRAVKDHFPESFASTLADREGRPYIVDFEGLVGEICQKDIRTFATNREHSRIYVHPNAEVYHFDVMADWKMDGKSAGIFFVSFPADIVARILKRGQLPGHKLLLLNRDIPGLIEIMDEGARIKLDREFKLTPDEMRRVGYSAPVNGTSWNLVDMPEADLFESTRNKIRREIGVIMALFVAISSTLLGLLLRTAVKHRELQHRYTHDARTGFPNRYFLLQNLQEMLYRKPKAQTPFALLMINLGSFRKTKGGFFDQDADEALLVQAGQRIQETLRQGDIFSYLQENEFAVLLNGAAREEAGKIVEKMLKALQQPFSESPENGHATLPRVRIGVAVYPDDGADAEALTQKAYVASCDPDSRPIPRA